jgi:transglutaminase-like putative cysteine protease
MQEYLKSNAWIDSDSKEINKLARRLKGHCVTDIKIAQSCFEYVRDNIRHSWDYQDSVVTCKASEVLKEKTGYCYSKSHLLAALLRANKIPAGLCYQRLSINGHGAPYCLHGLNAIFLKDFGWYRVDPRGNKEGVNAQFMPPDEHLAFDIKGRLEVDIPGIWAEPMPVIVRALQNNKTCKAVYDHLPDIDV